MSNTVYFQQLTAQLDGLVLFMGLRHAEVFEQITAHWDQWAPPDFRGTRVDTAQHFEQVILQSALLLGVTYVEAYFSNVLREIFRRKPQILAGRNKTVSWELVVKAGDYDAVLEHMIEVELSELSWGSIDEKFQYFSDRLGVTIAEGGDRELLNEAQLARNLITHNAAIANEELEKLNSEFGEGEQILLTAAQVDAYGVAGRTIIRDVDLQIAAKFLS